MCRNIRPLFHCEPAATEDDIRAAALQYVRKVSGIRRPSADDLAVFDRATRRIARATRELVDSLRTKTPPRNREGEAGPSDTRRR